ncbi:protocadherin gamma-A7-like [Nerophis lumbriciformis]|uniref:protocadherin gamma-A7-like n=1 Tax=Nerophis lumbriciformis TaxID=546530 RepID=UPI003BAD7FE1
MLCICKLTSNWLMETGKGLFTRGNHRTSFIFVTMRGNGYFSFSCAKWRSLNGSRWQIGSLMFLLHLVTTVGGQIRYSIPEEMKKGSVIGNVAQDLGLDVKRLRSGRARILTEDNIQYTELKTDKGLLVVNDRIDREQLCGDVTPCSFSFEVILENPLELHSVRILIQDQNDNAPQVLYPVQTGGSVLAEMVPRSADVGYLVTKVVAVDVDSGQNAWLSYKVHKATDRALFEVGLHNGEIRTVRQVTDKDAVKQRLSVLVEDNGQPSRSATVIVNVAVADSFPEVLSEFTDFSMHDKEYNDKLTFYLVLSLAVVSFLFITCLLLIISVKVYRWRQSRVLYHSNLPVIPYYPPRYSDTLGTGTLQHVYNYEVCRTTDSRKSDMKNMQAMSQSLVSVDGADADTPHVTKQMSGNFSQMSTLVSETFHLFFLFLKLTQLARGYNKITLQLENLVSTQLFRNIKVDLPCYSYTIFLDSCCLTLF